MVDQTRSFQSHFIMALQEKLTKQGVRDLNHPPPKRQPAPTEIADTVDEEIAPVPPAAAVPDGTASSPIEQ